MYVGGTAIRYCIMDLCIISANSLPNAVLSVHVHETRPISFLIWLTHLRQASALSLHPLTHTNECASLQDDETQRLQKQVVRR